MNKTNQKQRGTLLVAAAAGLMMVSAPLAAQAADYTWTGSGGDGLWASKANWAPAGVPGAADTVYIGGTAEVQMPSSVTVKNLRLGADARILNDGSLNVTGWTSSDGVLEGAGELSIPDGASATINLTATTTLARNPLYPAVAGAFCGKKKGKNDDKVKFGKVKNKGKLRVNIAPSVDVEFPDLTNDGGETTLNIEGADATPIKLKKLKNEKGTLTLKGTGGEGRAFQGEEISNKDKMVFEGAHTQTKNDWANEVGGVMTLKKGSLLDCADSSKKLENKGKVELTDGSAEIRMEWKNRGSLVVEEGNSLKIAPPDGKKVVQESGTTTLNDGTLEIVDSVTNPKDGGLQMKGGVLDGSGTINGNVTNDGGAVNVGHSPGLMTINGNFTQTANGLMNMEIWGTFPGYQYDQLRVSGNTWVDGTLNVIFGTSTMPNQYAFWHMKYGYYLGGRFHSVWFYNVPPGRYYNLIYSSSGVYTTTGLLANPNAAPSFYGVGFQAEAPKQYVRGL